MKTKHQESEKRKFSGNVYKTILVVLLLSSIFIMFKIQVVTADPTGATITYNSTGSGATYSPDSRSDAGGTITTLAINVTQQNNKWKAYVGNITGVLTLDDINGNTIYQWSMTSADITGEVYSTRASSPTWSAINCSNVTIIEGEDSTLGFSGSAVDSINKTFNDTTHSAVVVAGRTIVADTCRSTAPYVNDTKQDISSAYFQETLLGSGTDVIYSSPILQDVASYYNESIVDFQLILADDVSAAATTYYFFVEIGS